VIATAAELFDARHYPNVVAICGDALSDEPDCLPLLMIRARAHMALRRDLDAQTDLRDVIRIDPDCGLAYRLLGELATRRNHSSAAVAFFREALRLDPEDREAHDWLMIAEALVYPGEREARRGAATGAPRFARGTQANPDDDRPTQPFASAGIAGDARAAAADLDQDARTSVYRPRERILPALPGHRPTQSAPRLPALATPRATPRGPAADLPGFGEYLVTTGVLSRERLRAAEAYQRSMKVQLATAIVTLGLATPQRIEWAAVAHQSQLAGDPA
jgi:hypothetical protein